MTREEMARMIDHTFLKAAGERDAVERLCREAREFGFACAMVNPCEVKNASRLLAGSGVKVGTVIGFPLGQNSAAIKCAEARLALEDGAGELDYVVNVRLLKSAAAGDCEALEELRAELKSFVEAGAGAETKLIIECCYLTDGEKVLACRLAKEAGFGFVKTSTGFGPGGATVHDVRLMRETVGPEMGVKAAGGIRSLADAIAMVEAGANRLGCSAGVAILEEMA